MNTFDTIDFGIQVVSNINREDFHDYWNPQKGINLSAKTPFYFGDVQAGLQVSSFESLKRDVLGFNSFFIFAGWGVTIDFFHRWDWFNGFCVGNELMDFGKSVSKYSRFESELALSLNSQVAYHVNEKISVNVNASHKIIYTYNKIRLSFVSLGINYSMDTPAWIQDFLE